MWNTLFATSFKYPTAHLEMDMDTPRVTVFKDVL